MSDLPPRPVSKAILPTQVPLIKAFEAVKGSDPALWLMLTVGLRDYLQPEMRHILRCPPEYLPVSQGRAQIADDVLQIMDTCTELAQKLREQAAARTQPPSK